MDNIVIFKPLAQVSVEENIREFIDFSKNKLELFGKDLDWDSITWDVSGHVNRRGRKNKENIVWSNSGTATTQSKFSKTQMQEPFVSFAKAFIRYDQSLNSNSRVPDYLFAFRALEESLLNICGKADILYVSPNILDNTIHILKKKYKNPYAQANALELFYKFICENKLSLITIPWKSPIKCQIAGRDLVGNESVEYSKEKCPTDACLRAIAKIFHESEQTVDKLASSLALIQLAQPCRICEALTIPYNCEVHDLFGQHGGYGLSWNPAKGAPPTVKQILASWIDLVKEAVARIKTLTDEARQIALWYQNNPNEIYIPDEYAIWRDSEYIPANIVKDLLDKSKTTFNRFCNDYSIELIRGEKKKLLGIKTEYPQESLISKKDLSRAVCSLLPKEFPVFDETTELDYPDALFVVPWNFFRRDKFTFSKVMFQPVGMIEIANQYGMSDSVSMFDHNGFYESNGDRIVFNTHSARHWQNTVANFNHVPDLFISLWSGRKIAKQNEAYYHTTDEERFEQIQIALPDKSFLPKIDQKKVAVYDRINIIQNSIREMFGTAHVTDSGFCLRDLTMTPCRKIADHVTCSDHLYLKGDPRNELFRTILKEEELLLKNIEEQSKDEELYGVDMWYTYISQVVAIRRNIVSILDNDQVPKGSFFRLVINNEYNPVRIAIYNRTGELLGGNKDNIALELFGQIEIEG